MSLSEKIKSLKTGLAVLVAGAMITGVAYAKEIKEEGWPLPDDSKYTKAGEDIEKFSCNYKGKDVVVEVNTDAYANFEGEGYKKYSLGDKVFMYAKIEPGEGDCFKIEILMDRDGNGSMETKYTDDKELEQDGLPEWVLDEAEKNQNTKTN